MPQVRRIGSRCLVGLYLLLVLFPSLLLAQAEEGARTVYRISNMHTHPWFWEVLAGSAAGWLLGLVKGFSGARDWLENYWKTAPPLVLLLLDMLIFLGVGAYLGTGIYDPANFLAAMAAGVSWPVGLGALVTKRLGMISRVRQTNEDPRAPGGAAPPSLSPPPLAWRRSSRSYLLEALARYLWFGLGIAAAIVGAYFYILRYR